MFLIAALFVSYNKTAAQNVALPARDSSGAVRPLSSEQDTTKRAPEKKPPPHSDIHQVIPRTFPGSPKSGSPGVLKLRSFKEKQLPELTLDVVDSLSRLYPELRNYLLQEAIIQSALTQDLADTETRKLLERAVSDLHLPNELEAKLLRNQALFRTIENPMKPPPPPYQVNLFDAMTAIGNLFHYLGLR